MAKSKYIIAPDDLKDFMAIESCSDFPHDRYVLTEENRDIAKSINNMRKIVPEMRAMGIDYLNSTLLYGPPGTGKAQPLYSKVLTPTGFKLMGDMKLGDKVITPSGKIAEVAGLYPQGIKEVYELYFDDGSTCRCSEDHLWEVQGPEERVASAKQGKAIYRIMTLNDIREVLSNEDTEDPETYFCVRAIEPADIEDKEFAFSPYEYGKALAKGIVTNSEDYLFGSKKQRMTFLNSYIEHSEKVVSREDKTYVQLDDNEYHTAVFIMNLARSLGLKTSIKRPDRISAPGYNVRLERGDGRRYIKAINYVGSDECQCIYINDPEHLYITDDYIPTHNTVFGRFMAYSMHMDFVYLKFANLMGGSMGDTSRNITKVFDFIKDKRCIFMMDEIDAISTKRGYESAQTGGELGRITITVMQELDQLKREGADLIIIAASNVIKNIDTALISRFAIVKRVQTWTNREKEFYVNKYLKSLDIPYDKEQVHAYVTQNSSQQQRGIEADINRCISEWLLNGKKDFNLTHIREM